MIRADVALVAGPTDRPDHWSRIAAAWPAGGGRILAPVPVVAARRPAGIAWVAAHAAALHHTVGWGATGGALVLVGHGTSGPLLPALARTQRSGGRRVAGFVFVDATLPRPGVTTHLDLLRAAAPDDADDAHEHLHIDGATWPPNAGRPGDHDFWTDPLPPPVDWPDAPCAYVATPASPPGCGPVGFWSRSAAARGWKVRELEARPDTDTDGDVVIVDTLAEVIASLPGA